MKTVEHSNLLEFLERHNAATIALPIDANGTIHAASLLYWNSNNPFCFYFITSSSSEKCNLLNSKNELPCAVVVGTEKGVDYTLQMRGTIRKIDPKNYKKEVEAYYTKRGNKNDNIDHADSCLLQFSPRWARYTNYSHGYERHFIDLPS